MIKVIKAGLFSSIQDLGRKGYAAYGVPLSGVMDSQSAHIVNLLLCNSPECAVIEMTLIGGTYEFLEPTSIALSGAEVEVKLNNTIVKHNKPIHVNKGDMLSVGAFKKGCRLYLGIKNGIQVPSIMNSKSYYNSISPEYKLSNGMLLKMSLNPFNINVKHAKLKGVDLDTQVLKVYPGPEYDLLTNELKNNLLSYSFTIGQNNRMGYYLNENVENNLASILTSSVLPGTVQLTPSGQLIVLMKDAQTTGGYPRVLQLSDSALNILSQKRKGNTIKFVLLCMDKL